MAEEFNPNNITTSNLSVSDIVKMFSALLVPTINLPPLPPQLILSGSKFRGGLSPRKIAARIITRQTEAGAYIGPLPDGGENVSEKMEIIRIEELIYAIQNEAKVEVAINPGQEIDGVVTPAGVVKGFTRKIGNGSAIIR